MCVGLGPTDMGCDPIDVSSWWSCCGWCGKLHLKQYANVGFNITHRRIQYVYTWYASWHSVFLRNNTCITSLQDPRDEVALVRVSNQNTVRYCFYNFHTTLANISTRDETRKYKTFWYFKYNWLHLLWYKNTYNVYLFSITHACGPQS